MSAAECAARGLSEKQDSLCLYYRYAGYLGPIGTLGRIRDGPSIRGRKRTRRSEGKDFQLTTGSSWSPVLMSSKIAAVSKIGIASSTEAAALRGAPVRYIARSAVVSLSWVKVGRRFCGFASV